MVDFCGGDVGVAVVVTWAVKSRGEPNCPRPVTFSSKVASSWSTVSSNGERLSGSTHGPGLKVA